MNTGRPGGWSGWIAIPHGLGAVAVPGLLGLGVYMTRADLDAAAKFDLYQWHKTVGFLTLLLTLARVALRAFVRAPEPLASIPARTRALAGAAHVALYVLAVGVGVSGWARISSAIIPIPIDLFGLATAPDIAPVDADLSEALARVHRYLAYALAAVLVVHVAAALKHRFVDGDATLRRMFGGR
jgi:cytochrome b561